MNRFDFSAYGERFTVETDIQGMKSLYEEVFPEARIPCSNGEDSILIRLMECRAGVATLLDQPVRTTTSDEHFALSIGDQRVIELGEQEDAVAVSIDPQWLLSSSDLVRSLIIEAPVLVSLTFWRMPYLHAAAVSWGDRGFILAGGSGTGKSALAYACSKVGFDFVAEDYLFLSPTRGALIVRGSPAHLRLCTSAVTYFPELKSLPVALQPSGEHKLDAISEVSPRRRRFRTRLSRIFLLSSGQGPGRGIATHLIRGEALAEALAGELMFDREGTVRRYHKLFTELAARGAEPLYMAETPLVRAELLKQKVMAS